MSLDIDIYYDVVGRDDIKHCVHDQNITHNLTDMAEEAGIYGVVWRPEENGIEHARDLVGPLS